MKQLLKPFRDLELLRCPKRSDCFVRVLVLPHKLARLDQPNPDDVSLASLRQVIATGEDTHVPELGNRPALEPGKNNPRQIAKNEHEIELV